MMFDLLMRQLSEVLNESDAEMSLHVLGGILDKIYNNDAALRGKAPDLGNFSGIHNGNGGYVNAIPSSYKGACHKELLVLCLDGDNFSDRLREMVYHAGIYCRGINKIVIFATTKWDNAKYRIHKAAIDQLTSDGVYFNFILISDNGISKIPV